MNFVNGIIFKLILHNILFVNKLWIIINNLKINLNKLKIKLY